MSGSSKLRVIQLQRRTFSGHYSMERVFEQVRSALPEDIDAELYVASHFSKGLLPRLRTVFETRRLACAQFGHFPERSDAVPEVVIQCPN